MKLFGSTGGSHAGHTVQRTDKKVFKTQDEAPRDIIEAGESKQTVPVAEKKKAVSVKAASAAVPAKGASGKPKKKKKAWKVIVIIVAVLVILVAAGVIAYSIWEKPPEIVQDGPKVVETEVPETPAPQETQDVEQNVPQATATPEPTPEPVESTRKDGTYTFLLAAYDQVGSNTDTIIVGRMDTKEETINLVSIPRDTYLNVSWSVKKLNSVLAVNHNDVNAFKDTIADIIGFDVDFYAIVDIQAVEKLIDCIGGVDYNVPINMNYDDPTQDLHIHINAGYQHLNGTQGVQVLRFREGNKGSGYANGDIGRIATQQSFLKAVASQMLTVGNIPNLSKAIDIFTTYVDTDLTANNLAYLAREFLKMSTDSITMTTAPGYSTGRGGLSYWVINKEEMLTVINEKLNPYTVDITAANLNIAS